ncbi:MULTISPECIES: hypothetical protein [unclassified Arthrobacter]|uniref:hypothetical protein n=1 Tax=unclassified Arthrobacter TaxID=235627 RepID=UPI0033930D8D
MTEQPPAAVTEDLWFEWDKEEVEVRGRVDRTVTNTPTIREAFTRDLPGWLRYGSSLSCEPAK